MRPLRVAFLWHLHQPLYRTRGERSCFFPWVRLHAIRSYYDMARILEEFPGLRMTFNLTCTLIEQLRAYERGEGDLFLEAASAPASELDDARRAFLFEHFFASHRERMIGELPRYADLYERRERARRLRGPAEGWRELATADYSDLQALFDLSWFGFKAREDFPVLRSLAERGTEYTFEHVREIHAVERQILSRILPLYRQAAERGQIEISTSPYAHPILPLLLDSDSAREALPLAPLPPRFREPDDARAQIDDALEAVQRKLGRRPLGMWPAEGAVSEEAVTLLERRGVAWAASDDQVLAASELETPADARRPWVIPSAPGLRLLFRDHDLSDRIGFTYARMEPQEAAADLLSELRRRSTGEDEERMVLLALDGENPWEQYPRAGARFLRALYRALSEARDLSCDTAAGAAAAFETPGRIRRLRSGSWIQAGFGTWIGGPERNLAWGLLGRVRSSLSGPLADPGIAAEARRAAWESLRSAEGSDWFWWLDGQFSTPYRAQFDQIFRAHLRQAHEALGRPAPAELEWPIPQLERRAEAQRHGEACGVLRPDIDGYEGSYFEWAGAVWIPWSSLEAASSMQRGVRAFDSLRFGFTSAGEFCLRLDPGPGTGPAALMGLGVDLLFQLDGRTLELAVDLDERGDLRRARLSGRGERDSGPRPCAARAAARKIFELAVAWAELGLAPESAVGLRVKVRGPIDEPPGREIGLRAPAGSRP